MTRTWLLVAAYFIVLLVPGAACAGIVTYTDPGLFALQVAPGGCTQDFTTLSSSLGNNVEYCNGTFPYSASSETGLYGSGGLSANTSTDTLSLAFVTTLPTAIGGYFFSADGAGAVVPDTITLGLSVDNGAHYTRWTFDVTSTPVFMGFVQPGLAFTNFQVFSGTQGAGSNFPTIQSLDVGAAVPEPASLGLAGLALAALAWIGKQQLRS